eukprot:gene14657-20691_t
MAARKAQALHLKGGLDPEAQAQDLHQSSPDTGVSGSQFREEGKKELAEAMAEASTAYLNKFDKAVESLLKMVHTGVYNRRGPAAHILAASLPAMAYQKETIPTLIKLGLIDRGDNKDGEHALGRGRSSRKGKQHSVSREGDGAPYAAKWGITPPPSGVVRVLVDIRKGKQLQHSVSREGDGASYAAKWGITPPPSGVVRVLVDNRKGKQLQHSVSREGDGAPYAAKWGITSHRAGLVGVLVDSEVPAHALCAGACLALITTAYSTSAALPEAAKKVLIKDNWTRRVLEAGAWPNLVSCLAVLPECTELQQVVAIAMMHLAEELATKYDEIQLEHEISLRRSRSSSRSRSPRREPRHADAPAVSLSQLPLESPNGLTPRLLRWNSLTKPPGILIRDAGETEGMDMGPDLHRVFRLLLHGRFDSTEEAVKVLAQLLKSRDMSVVQCAAMATFHLASIPTLKEPLGVVGVVESLVTYIRRWVDLFSASDQHDERHACEWVMTALEKLMQEPGGSNNVQRFSQCWKKMEDKREGDILEMNGFGYLMDVVPGQVPGKMGETEMELIERTMWSGFGWGRGQVVAPAGSDPTLKASRAPLKRGSHSSSSGGALKGKAGEAAAKGASSSGLFPHKGSHSSSSGSAVKGKAGVAAAKGTTSSVKTFQGFPQKGQPLELQWSALKGKAGVAAAKGASSSERAATRAPVAETSRERHGCLLRREPHHLGSHSSSSGGGLKGKAGAPAANGSAYLLSGPSFVSAGSHSSSSGGGLKGKAGVAAAKGSANLLSGPSFVSAVHLST